VSLAYNSIVVLLLEEHLLLDLGFVDLLVRGHVEIVDDIGDVRHPIWSSLSMLIWTRSSRRVNHDLRICLIGGYKLSVIWMVRGSFLNVLCGQRFASLRLLLGKPRINQWL